MRITIESKDDVEAKEIMDLCYNTIRKHNSKLDLVKEEVDIDCGTIKYTIEMEEL